MYRTWVESDSDRRALARALEAHLNEFAAEIISVSYAVDGEFHVLAVYRAIETGGSAQEEAAVAQAEEIIETLD